MKTEFIKGTEIEEGYFDAIVTVPSLFSAIVCRKGGNSNFFCLIHVE